MSRKIPLSKLRLLIEYAPETGVLRWKPRCADDFVDGRYTAQAYANRWNGRYAGTEALTAIGSTGYRHGSLCGSTVDAHIVAAALLLGAWPEGEVDHENGDRLDNRAANLRTGPVGHNQCNRALPVNNTSGVIGVHPVRDKWAAQIRRNGRVEHLGSFLTVEAAASARQQAEVRYGFHVNHGRSARRAAP